jgi:predicted Zn finger-like uncharacterized protein
MPEILSCPQCDKKMRVTEDTLGKRVKCPGCGHIFVAVAPAPPPPPPPAAVTSKRPWEGADEEEQNEVRAEEVENEEPEKRPARKEKPRPSAPPDEDADAWRSVQTGLAVHCVANLFLMGGWVLLAILVAVVVGSESGSRPSMALIGLLGLLGGLCVLFGWLVTLVASALWTSGPARHAARGLAVAGLVLGTLVLLLSLEAARSSGSAFEGRHGYSEERAATIAFAVALLAAMMVETARLTVVGCTLKSFASCLGMQKAISQGAMLIVLTPALLLGLLVVSTMIQALADVGPTVRLVLGVVNFAAYLWLLFLGMTLAASIRRRVARDYPSDEEDD